MCVRHFFSLRDARCLPYNGLTGVSSAQLKMQSAKELNELSDDVLTERVLAVLASLDGDERQEGLPRIAPFITAQVLLRLHNIVQKLRSQSHWNKHACLAMVVASFTGIRLNSKAEAEHIGNAQDAYLRHHVEALKKVKQSLSVATCKAKKVGKQISSQYMERVVSLEERVYKCTFGGVPRNICLPDIPRRRVGSPSTPNRSHFGGSSLLTR